MRCEQKVVQCGEGAFASKERTYGVVRSKVSRSADGGERWVSAARLVESLWTGTVAASAFEAKRAITTVDSMERMCIIKNGFTSAGLSERGRIQILDSERSLTATRWSRISIAKWSIIEQRVTSDIKTAGEDRTGRRQYE